MEEIVGLPRLKSVQVKYPKKIKYKLPKYDVPEWAKKDWPKKRSKKVIKKIQLDGPELKMQQLYIAPWGRNGDLSYSVFGLTTEGKVYRWDGKCTGWIPWNMHEAECAAEHKK